jgi:hypothetical protein
MTNRIVVIIVTCYSNPREVKVGRLEHQTSLYLLSVPSLFLSPITGPEKQHVLRK